MTEPPQPVARGAERDPFAQSLAEVAAARGLPILGKVIGRRVGREEMLDEVDREIAREVPPEALLGSAELLRALELAPADFDYAAAIRKLMGAKLAGFYQPRTKTMFLAQDLPVQEQILTLNHELAHALQDQHYALGDRMRYREDAGDEQAAIHALAEGDATSIMLDMLLSPQGKNALELDQDILGGDDLPPEAADVPPVLVRSVLAPYRDGLEFVHWLRKRGGWKAVDAAWKRMPVSTEQIIHPEKYIRGEAPVVVSTPVPPGKEWSVYYHEVMGEQGMRACVAEWFPEGVAAATVRGWGGDKIAVYDAPGQRAVAWRMVWDDQAGAARIEEALASGLLRQGGKTGSAPATKTGAASDAAGAPKTGSPAAAGKARCREGKTGSIALQRRGAEVALVVGPYGAAHGKPRAGCAAATKWVSAILAAPR